MAAKTFRAMVVRETENNTFQRSIEERSIDDLPEGDVLIRVHYSSLNYKDALSAIGNRGVTKKYPHTPGIDAAGIVEESRSSRFKPGSKVIVTGWDLGMNTAGGFGEYIRVPEDWVICIPEGLDIRQSMIYGTAGLTAGLSIRRMFEVGASNEDGDFLVSGAAGGVGSIAATILVRLGHIVTAVNSRTDKSHIIKQLGVHHIISPEEAIDTSGKPLLKARWKGAVDTVGGDILTTAIKSTNLHGTVVCCGNVASPDLPLNVYPFILRGVSLVGIDSQNCIYEERIATWNKLATQWDIHYPEALVTEVTLDELSDQIDLMLQGKHWGRTIVRMV